MKNIYLIRHAKADDPMLYDLDYERPLKERGKNDAVTMAERLSAALIKPDLILSSPAARTMQTIQIIKDEMKLESAIIEELDLYLPMPSVIDDVITQIDDNSVNTVFIVTHNFGITDYANFKVNDFSINNIPTCGIVGFTLPITSFKDNNPAIKGTLKYWNFPKKTQ